MKLIFLWLKTPCKISEPFDNPFWEKIKWSRKKEEVDYCGNLQICELLESWHIGLGSSVVSCVKYLTWMFRRHVWGWRCSFNLKYELYGGNISPLQMHLASHWYVNAEWKHACKGLFINYFCTRKHCQEQPKSFTQKQHLFAGQYCFGRQRV